MKGWEAGSIDVHVNPRYPNLSLDVLPGTYRHISHRSTAPFWTAQHQHDFPYLSISASLTRTVTGNDDQEEDDYQGRVGQHEANNDTASGTILSPTPSDRSAESGKAQKPDRPDGRKERALDKVCE